MNKNNYWTSCLYPLFLSSIKSCTYCQYTDSELQAELDILAKRAIARFKFPKQDLSFAYDAEIEDMNLPVVERSAKGYYFTLEKDIGLRELNVLVEWMRVYYLEWQLGREEIYENNYADKDVKEFSSAALISSIKGSLEAAVTIARKTEEDYSRVNSQGKPRIGDVNE